MKSRIYETCGGKFLRVSSEEYNVTVMEWVEAMQQCPSYRLGQHFANKWLLGDESFSELFHSKNEDISLYLWIEDECKTNPENWNPCMEGDEYE